MIKDGILRTLRASGTFVSGQSLCKALNVSRTAVWKAVSSLKDSGYEIESVQNRGYRLVSEPDELSAVQIKSFLNTRVMGQACICYDETDSTNLRIKQLAEEGAAHGTLACTGVQTAGRGRRGRGWEAPPGEAIAMSLLLRPDIRPEHASMLTLVMGLAAASACNEYLHQICADGSREPAPITLKWPNDLVWHGKKVSGILTEMSAEMDYIHYIVIGIGINVNTRAFPEELPNAASLCQITGVPLNRARLVALCMEHFEKYYHTFLATEDLSMLRAEYESLLANKGREVCVLDPAGSYTGTALGIDRLGELLVQCADGHVEKVFSGEVSVRGIYGYV